MKPKGEGKTIKNATFSAELQRVSRKFRIFAPINDKTTANMATDKVAYWLDIANYDLDTAEALYNSGRWLYVAFMCHQVIEKTLKARDPEDKDALSRTLTPQACRQIINETKQLQQWIEGHLPETRPSNSSADTSES